MEENLAEFLRIKSTFIDRFQKIAARGFLSTGRSGPKAVGSTFEDLMDIEENNIPGPDYHGYIEIKCQRSPAKSLLTLFTIKFDGPEGISAKLRKEYGEPDQETNMHTLRTTINHSDFNTYKQRWGFKSDIREGASKIYIQIRNLVTNNLEPIDAHFSFNTIRESVEKKLALIAYITADHQGKGTEEKFHYKSLQFLSGLEFPRFLDLIRNDTIKIDLRLGEDRPDHSTDSAIDPIKNIKRKHPRNTEDDKPHDHGNAFRVSPSRLNLLFNIEDIPIDSTHVVNLDLTPSKKAGLDKYFPPPDTS